jgi:hypothetical protein
MPPFDGKAFIFSALVSVKRAAAKIAKCRDTDRSMVMKESPKAQ